MKLSQSPALAGRTGPWTIRLVLGLCSAVALLLSGPRVLQPVLAASTPASISSSHIMIRHSNRFGRLLSNGRGMTLYYFKADSAGRPSCVGQCAQLWPPVLVPRSGHVPKFHLPGKVGSVARGNARQLTYNGWPLYTFSGDKRPGETSGEGIAGLWFVATPKIRSRLAHAAPSPPPAQQPPPAPPMANCIPDNDGGDQDGDNNGYPSDGDGCR